VFLLGDAAHLTPPFIGQGMGAGVRDAANLAWKLAGVLDGSLPEGLLDTYQRERKPHARALIRLARLVGMAMTEGGELGNVLRRLVAPRLYLVPGVARLVLSSETPALHGGELVIRPRLGRSLAGRLCPNVLLDDGRRFDDVAGGRFAVVTTTGASPDQRSEVARRGAVLVPARPGTPLHRWLRRGHATSAIVRPDGTVLRAGRDLSALCAGLPPFTPHRTPVTSGLGQASTAR
jgi:3-(3-hydroxy-phenyl)propionate hydroxylase